MKSLAMLGGKGKGRKIISGGMINPLLGNMSMNSGTSGMEETIKTIIRVIVYVIIAIIIYYVWWDDLVVLFLKVQCSRFSWPVGMINEIEPLPMCISLSKTITDRTIVEQEEEGEGASGYLHVYHDQKAADGPIGAESSNEALISDLTEVLNELEQSTEQITGASQEIDRPNKITFPKNEKNAQRQVYIKDNVNETVQMGEIPSDPKQRCTNGDPIMKPNTNRYECNNNKYNIFLPTGIKKNVSLEQLSPVYGCIPNFEQSQTISTYQMNTSENKFTKKILNKIDLFTQTKLQTVGDITDCDPKVDQSAKGRIRVTMETLIRNQIRQLITQNVNVSQKLKIHDRYGMCSPPYPFKCKKLKSDVIYRQKDNKCNCDELKGVNGGNWVKKVVEECDDPSKCRCYNCCQSNQRWIRQHITIESVAINIASAAQEIFMKNNIKSSVENTVVYIQDVPARIFMLSLLWNVLAIYILYYTVKYIRKFL